LAFPKELAMKNRSLTYPALAAWMVTWLAASADAM